MKRIAAFLLALFLTGCAVAGAPAPVAAPTADHAAMVDAHDQVAALDGAPDPLTCTGYPESRVFLEVQSWWKEPSIADQMHLHAGTCFPLAQTISGTLHLDIRLMLHKNVGTLKALSVDFYQGGDDPNNYFNIGPYTCTDPSGLCTYWVSVDLDSNDAADGWHEIRLKPRAFFPPPFDTDPGATQITSTGWPIRIDNGSHVNTGNRSECQNTTPGAECQVQFRGWYEHRGYANVAPWSARDIIPIPTVSGSTWSIVWRIYNNLGNGEDKQLTTADCYIDPNFHDPTITNVPFWSYTFPAGAKVKKTAIALPLTGLANGLHREVCMVHSNLPSDPTPGELTGVGVVQFNVAN